MPLVVLPNGIKAVFYDSRSVGTERILKVCEAKNRKAEKYCKHRCLLKVGIGYELVFLVLSIYPPTEKTIAKILSLEGLRGILDRTTFIVYRDTAYWWYEETGKILLNSVERRVPPEVCALIFPDRNLDYNK